MKVSLLNLSVVTLLLLHSRYVSSASSDVWLPSAEKMSSIIHICEHELSLETIHALPKRPISYSNSPPRAQSNAPEALNKYDIDEPSILASSKVDIKLSKAGMSILQSFDVEKNKGNRDLPDLHLLQKTLPEQATVRTVGVNVNDQSMANNNFGLVSARGGHGGRSIARTQEKEPLRLRFGRSVPINNVVSLNNDNKQSEKPAYRSVGINVGHEGTKNLNNAIDDSVSIQNRSPIGTIYQNKRKYRDIAICVKRRLLKTYQEEMAFFD